MKIINLPLGERKLSELQVGEMVHINGTLYTARDQAHIKLIELINKGEALPIDLKNATIYYCGPTPAKTGKIVGSVGPTTSLRMDELTVPLLKMGLKLMIGKGERSNEVVEGIIKYGAVYLCAVGGAGALYAKCIKSCELVAYPELLSEAIYKLEVENFPAVVAIDTKGDQI